MPYEHYDDWHGQELPDDLTRYGIKPDHDGWFTELLAARKADRCTCTQEWKDYLTTLHETFFHWPGSRMSDQPRCPHAFIETLVDARDFIRSYESAVSAGVNEYQWRGQTVLVAYGKYLVAYLKSQGIT